MSVFNTMRRKPTKSHKYNAKERSIAINIWILNRRIKNKLNIKDIIKRDNLIFLLNGKYILPN